MSQTEQNSSSLEWLSKHIQEKQSPCVEETALTHGQLSVSIRASALCAFMQFLRDDPVCSFTQLVSLCGADYPARAQRFDLVYHLLSIQHNLRIRVKLRADEQTPVDTLTGVFPSAGWYEREVWDLFGVRFANHPDLRRILTDYGFEGHPLRKDFPLSGHVEVRYDTEQRRVVYGPVHLVQEYRSFDSLSPWEGMTDVQLRARGEK